MRLAMVEWTPSEEALVTDSPLDRGEVDETSESLSELREDDDETEETFLSLCAVARSWALYVWTFVVERRTGEDILEIMGLSKAGWALDGLLVRRDGIACSSADSGRFLRVVKARTIDMVERWAV